MVNIGLILGGALLFGALVVQWAEWRRDFVLALGVPVLTLILALDGTVSRAEGALLLTLFTVWMALVTRQAIAHRRAVTTEDSAPGRPGRAWLLLLVGLASLVLAGRLFVTGASGLAMALEVHPYLIGVTVVAVGTSLPELVTVLLSRLRGHDDVGLGTLLGSNLFNGLAIVGITATLHPIQTTPGEVAVALGFGVLTVLMLLPRAGALSRRRGVALLTAYAVFIVVTVSLSR